MAGRPANNQLKEGKMDDQQIVLVVLGGILMIAMIAGLVNQPQGGDGDGDE